ncbi:hypothetical protein [Pseudomonas marginalis]|uniref:hypothetical protein n=1 Tax=Pseudomonas fluorescens group TaxID=136843 RepID=UPI001F3068EB|nr:hypothetical protein [Pseudomonas marginalis]MCF5668231.1 hypothetical protein [Pseudomonas marginalis]
MEFNSTKAKLNFTCIIIKTVGKMPAFCRRLTSHYYRRAAILSKITLDQTSKNEL